MAAMQKKRFLCEHCDRAFERVVGEAVLSAVCPGCGRLAKLVKLGMDLGLSLGQAVFGVLLGYVVYRLWSE
jgi:Zn finger protein HypA/HybF involved in hydrogenase expression